MLPPVDPSVLQRNPNFEVLYKDLCTRKLNPDGSTRDAKKQRIHDEIRRDLQSSLLTTHQTTTLLKTLTTLPQKSPTLPPSLHAPIDLITAHLHLTTHLPQSDHTMLSGDISTFHANMDIIASATSTQLTTIATLLCKIADPMAPPDIDTLRLRASKLRDAATLQGPRDLGDEKVRLANLVYQVLALHRDVLTTSISILEQTQHGSLARHTKAKAEALHVRATVLGLQAKLHTHTHPPPAAFLAALKNFKASQGSSEVRLKDREGLARRTLELYDRAGDKGMGDLAKRKEWILGEVARMEAEIGRLEKGN
ncbi:hypothetical protein P280DRAFT_54665 [Massarina eburnea CBS 473.64]|uniref:HAUS augmin-like complex subunit 4 n=1 Tax=Massarina eburnea CBS 473.64 TaxID=1395130 RepID=A0A6A6RY42_9PLEO|nr:hypothetical protein P280DRAFT_54665 [Massarina eburnea CBS 473.64]